MSLRDFPSMDKPDLSVVVPAFNEGWCIDRTLSVLHRRLQGISAEVILVDDGSQDDTGEKVARWHLENPWPALRYVRCPDTGGKGSAVRRGIEQSLGRTVAYLDADLEIPARELVRLFATQAGDLTRVIIGTKRGTNKSGQKSVGANWRRRAISWTFAGIVRRLFRLPIKDTQTGLKIYPGSWLRETGERLHVNGFLFDVELLVLAHRDGLHLVETPVQYISKRPLNRIRTRHIMQCVAELVRLRWHYRSRGVSQRMPLNDATCES